MVGHPAAFHSIQNSMIKSLYCGQQQAPGGQLLFPGYPALPASLLSGGAPLLPAPTSSLAGTSPPTLPISQPSTGSKKFRPPQKCPRYIPKPIPVELGNLKTYSNPDILICGNCRELFNDLVDMLEHKKSYCKMRFTCRCEQKDEDDISVQKAITDSSPSGLSVGGSSGRRVCLRCSQCSETFTGAWDLMFHAQNAHHINIYTLSDKPKHLPGSVSLPPGQASDPTAETQSRPQLGVPSGPSGPVVSGP